MQSPECYPAYSIATPVRAEWARSNERQHGNEGAVAVLGFVAVSAGLATGQVAIVAVLGSLQSAVAVGLACALLGEQLARHQWLGVAVVVAGLGLVRLG